MKDKKTEKMKDTNVELAREIGPEQLKTGASIGNFTRNLVKIAEQSLAKNTGNDPTPDENSKNK